MEYHGLTTISKDKIVDTKRLQSKKSQLDNLNNELTKIATSKKWQDIESKRLLSKQVEQMRDDIRTESINVEKQTEEAINTANQFRVFSVILIVMSLLASFCIESSNISVSDNSIEPFLQSSTMKTQTVEQTVKPTVNGSYTANESDIKLLSERERITLASEYIKHTNETDHRLLAKRFFLSFKAVKIAKEKSGVSRLKEQKIEQSQIGF
jgi:hypothetical protein